jgi:hypothetical protein
MKLEKKIDLEKKYRDNLIEKKQKKKNLSQPRLIY